MKEEAIRKLYEEHDPVREYLCEVARRLEPLFPAGIPNLESGMALLYILTGNGITFEDGFVINDLRDLNKTIGSEEAAAVVAALDAGEEQAEWWSDQRFTQPASAEDKLIYHDLLARIRALPGVESVD